MQKQEKERMEQLWNLCMFVCADAQVEYMSSPPQITGTQNLLFPPLNPISL